MKPYVLAGAILGLLPLHPAWAAAPLSTHDQSFVQQAAIGGLAEVQEGQIAVSRGKAADVKLFGQRMVDEHTSNNKALMALAEQKRVTVPTAPDAKHASALAALQKESGAAFDRAYITGQVSGHEEMASLMQSEIQSGSDSDLKAFAEKTLPVIQEHLQMAKRLQVKS
jgi:putative membrane protein